jgi:hypothetical protein
VALTGHLQVAQPTGAASATPTAALSGPITKAPGFAGEYLLINMKVAKSLRLAVPEALLATADEMIQ